MNILIFYIEFEDASGRTRAPLLFCLHTKRGVCVMSMDVVDEGSNLAQLLERDRLYVALKRTSPLVGVPNWLPLSYPWRAVKLG